MVFDQFSLQLFVAIFSVIFKFLKWLFSEQGSHVIYNLGLGMGSFLGGLAGLAYVHEWLKNYKRKQLVKKYKKKYPKELEDQSGWELTHDPKRKGHLYLLDHRDKSRHWIANWDSFRDLFINVPEYGDERKNKLFIQYTQEENIITTGEPEP